MSPRYRLEGFNESFDRWIDRGGASARPSTVVFDWIFTRYEEPYQGVRRARGFANLWYGAVPGSSHGGEAVQCSYFIFEAEQRVKCDSFMTLGEPI